MLHSGHSFVVAGAGADGSFFRIIVFMLLMTRNTQKATITKSISELIDGLGVGGRVIVVGAAPGPIEVSPAQLIFVRHEVRGWPSGVATDSEDTLRFAELTGVKPMVEPYPLARVKEAFARMESGHAQFRVVLTM